MSPRRLDLVVADVGAELLELAGEVARVLRVPKRQSLSKDTARKRVSGRDGCSANGSK